MTRDKLIQEYYIPDVWKMMVCCVFLNQTSRTQLEGIIDEFFEKYPEPRCFMTNDKDEVLELIKPLGLYNRRYNTLVNFTDDYIRKYEPSKRNIFELYGMGKYSTDCYRLMYLNDLTVEPSDKALKSYRERMLNQEVF